MGMRANLSAVEAEAHQPKPTKGFHLSPLMPVLFQSYNEAALHDWPLCVPEDATMGLSRL